MTENVVRQRAISPQVERMIRASLELENKQLTAEEEDALIYEGRFPDWLTRQIEARQK